MEVSVDQIKALRARTSVGIMDCKRALEESGGDLDKAENILKAAGLAAAVKRASRETREGLVEAYIHPGARLGAIRRTRLRDRLRRPHRRIQGPRPRPRHAGRRNGPPVHPRRRPGRGRNTPAGRSLPPQADLHQRPPAAGWKNSSRETIGKVGENIRVNRFSPLRPGRVERRNGGLRL